MFRRRKERNCQQKCVRKLRVLQKLANLALLIVVNTLLPFLVRTTLENITSIYIAVRRYIIFDNVLVKKILKKLLIKIKSLFEHFKNTCESEPSENPKTINYIFLVAELSVSGTYWVRSVLVIRVDSVSLRSTPHASSSHTRARWFQVSPKQQCLYKHRYTASLKLPH